MLFLFFFLLVIDSIKASFSFKYIFSVGKISEYYTGYPVYSAKHEVLNAGGILGVSVYDGAEQEHGAPCNYGGQHSNHQIHPDLFIFAEDLVGPWPPFEPVSEFILDIWFVFCGGGFFRTAFHRTVYLFVFHFITFPGLMILYQKL